MAAVGQALAQGEELQQELQEAEEEADLDLVEEGVGAEVHSSAIQTKS